MAQNTIAVVLIACCVSVNAAEKGVAQPLTRHNPLYVAASKGDDRAIMRLLENFDPNERSSTGETLLHFATKDDNVIAAKKLLKAAADPDARNNRGEGPLHLAAATNHDKVAKVFLDYAAKPNLVNQDNETPLHYAARSGSVRVATLLLSRGAKPNLKNRFGKTPLSLASGQTAQVIKGHGGTW